MRKFAIGNHALRILLGTVSLVLIAGAMFGPIYAIFVEEIGGSLFDASFAAGLFALTAAITTVIAGTYIDNIRENKQVLVFGYIITGIGFLGYTHISSVFGLFMVEMILGVGEAVSWPAFDALYSRHLDKHKEGSEWAAYEAMAYLVGFFGAMTGGLVVTFFTFGTLFSLMAVLCFMSAAYLLFLPRNVL